MEKKRILISIILLLPPSTKLREGNVFTSVILFTGVQGRGLCPGGYLSRGSLSLYGKERTIRILLERFLV